MHQTALGARERKRQRASRQNDGGLRAQVQDSVQAPPARPARQTSAAAAPALALLEQCGAAACAPHPRAALAGAHALARHPRESADARHPGHPRY
jgi:hypothetical protein